MSALPGFEVFDRVAHSSRRRSELVVNVTDRGLRLSAAARRALGTADVALLHDRPAGAFAIAPAVEVNAGPMHSYRLSRVGQIGCPSFVRFLDLRVGPYPVRVEGRTLIGATS